MTTSFFNGESTFPENNTTDQLVDALTVQLNITDAASQAAQAAATLAASSAANAAISETNVAGLSQQANDTLAQANTTLAAANAAIAATAASATAAAGSATAAAASATSAGTASGQASVSETNAAASQVAAAASQADALVSKNSATASASAALASKNAAATSETNAGASATSATSSKNAAATSASNAATSETNANTSKNAAATSATNAATSEGNAATSATASAASALVAQGFTASLAGRNRIINGDPRVIQRGAGVNFTNGQSGYASCDRWKTAVSATSANIFLGQTTLVDPVSGATKSCAFLRVDGVPSSLTAANYLNGLYQPMEGVNAYDLIGKQISVSFLFKAIVAGQYSVAIKDSTAAYSYVTTFSYTVANAVQRVTFTTPAVPTAASIPLSSSTGLSLSIGAINTGTFQAPSTNAWNTGNYLSASGNVNWAATLNNTIAITDVQLEEGAVCTPFERRAYGQELALCQRYYEKLGGEAQYDILFQGYGFGTGTVALTMPYKVTKRAAPTVAKVGTWAVSNCTQPTIVASANASVVTANATVTATGQVQINTVDTTTYITASAEL